MMETQLEQAAAASNLPPAHPTAVKSPELK